MKFHVIFNNSTGAPASTISEHEDELVLKLVEVEEDQINDVAWDCKCSRAHLYEAHDDGITVTYQYVTTIATTYESYE